MQLEDGHYARDQKFPPKWQYCAGLREAHELLIPSESPLAGPSSGIILHTVHKCVRVSWHISGFPAESGVQRYLLSTLPSASEINGPIPRRVDQPVPCPFALYIFDCTLRAVTVEPFTRLDRDGSWEELYRARDYSTISHLFI